VRHKVWTGKGYSRHTKCVNDQQIRREELAATNQIPSLFNDYDDFIKKFKPKKTTDDCMTPPEIYEIVKDWACREYGIDPAKVVRPFWPGGDYEHFDYSGGVMQSSVVFFGLNFFIKSS